MSNYEDQPVIIQSQGQEMRANFCLPRPEAPCVVASHGLEGSKDGDKWLILSQRLYDAVWLI
jgi:predicted alpha/beta-fold hydrolase